MPLSLEELSSRFQSVCEKIQDSIEVIESQMGSQQQFTFDLNQENYALNSIDVNGAEKDATRYILVLQEYKKMLAYEKSRRRLEDQIKSADRMKSLKDDLKKRRNLRKLQTNPYRKKGTKTE